METQFPQIYERLHGRRFTLADSLHSAPAERTVYDYAVDGDEIFGSLWGGKIERGSFYGRATGSDSIELLYHCTTTGGEEFAGWSRGDISIDAAGHTTLSMAWGWLAAATGGLVPDYVELSESGASKSPRQEGI